LTQNANRITHLEAVIDKLGNVFLELADELLGSGLPNIDLQLSRKFHNSLRGSLSLIKENVDEVQQPHHDDSATENSYNSLPQISRSSRNLHNMAPSTMQSDRLEALKEVMSHGMVYYPAV
jgi:hypothetical protein